MQRAKRKSGNNKYIKHKYKSIDEFYEEIKEKPETLIFEDKNHPSKSTSIQAHLIESSSKNRHLMLYDEKLMKEFDENNVMGADGSFRAVPNIKGVKQIFTIFCKKRGKVSSLSLYIIMIYL